MQEPQLPGIAVLAFTRNTTKYIPGTKEQNDTRIVRTNMECQYSLGLLGLSSILVGTFKLVRIGNTTIT